MPLPLPKHNTPHRRLLRDVRPASQRIAESMDQPQAMAITACVFCGALAFLSSAYGGLMDIAVIAGLLYFRWGLKRPFHLPFKLPKNAGIKDPRNPPAGGAGAGKAEGILYIGNTSDVDNPDYGQEMWFTNNDARTHILYLGTTGAGKTEGLKALVTNALAWGSGYVYVDGKADTDLWASLYSVARRFGRDDDIFVLNYMTGNSDDGSMSNTMNPFSNGSSSYLANMIVSFMPDAGGDNAMWKERAVALMFALMPALTFKRDKGGMLLDIGIVRDYIELQSIIKLSRDPLLPERIAGGLQGYLRTLPGYVDAAFDDEGNERPPSPDQPMYDLQIARQQHGYLSMQFTRSLQMLADEYGYIFKAQLADVDVLDVVLNRRILVTLIPALEKAGDEAANLGKIVASSLKGMMGATLGNSVEGTWETAIGSKQTRSSSSFMTVFDEVGYYTAPGMAVMAAQARSLGFSLVFASQDIPAMEKRIKTEARSIVGNCNIKIFGRIEDPTDTKDFLTKHGGTYLAIESTSMSVNPDGLAATFMHAPFQDDMKGGNAQPRQRVDYDHLRDQREGDIHIFFADWVSKGRMFFVSPEKVKALRVQRLLPVPGTNDMMAKRDRAMTEMVSRLKDPAWTAAASVAPVAASPELNALARGMALAHDPLSGGIMAMEALGAVPMAKTKTMVPVETDDEDATPELSARAARNEPPPARKPAEAVTMPMAAATSGNTLSPSERSSRPAGFPPLFEGDQFAILEVEPQNGSGIPGAGFAASDADFSLVTPTGAEDDDTEIMDVALPPDIAAILERSAQKLNKGLAGDDTRK